MKLLTTPQHFPMTNLPGLVIVILTYSNPIYRILGDLGQVKGVQNFTYNCDLESTVLLRILLKASAKSSRYFLCNDLNYCKWKDIHWTYLLTLCE